MQTRRSIISSSRVAILLRYGTILHQAGPSLLIHFSPFLRDSSFDWLFTRHLQRKPVHWSGPGGQGDHHPKHHEKHTAPGPIPMATRKSECHWIQPSTECMRTPTQICSGTCALCLYILKKSLFSNPELVSHHLVVVECSIIRSLNGADADNSLSKPFIHCGIWRKKYVTRIIS